MMNTGCVDASLAAGTMLVPWTSVTSADSPAEARGLFHLAGGSMDGIRTSGFQKFPHPREGTPHLGFLAALETLC